MARKKKQSADEIANELFEDGIIASEVEKVDAIVSSAENFYEYGSMVNSERAVPDIRDGLLSVQRRALHTAYDLNMSTDKLMGSAEFAGSAMRFHPHADTSLYDSVVRLTQQDRHPVPIFTLSGSNGSMVDQHAALRYTKVRPNDATMAMLGHDDENSTKNEIDYEAVEIADSFDGSYREVQILPSMLPNYLINGHEHGIGVGMRADIPKHNPKEVLDLAAHLLKLGSANIRTSTLMKIMPGPDFPLSHVNSTGVGIDIFDTPSGGIESYLTTGSGSFVMQASYHLEEYALTKKENGTRIVFDELPYGVAKDKIKEAFQKMVDDGLLPDSIKLHETADKQLAVDIHKYDAEDVLPYLFAHTPLRTNYHANMVANFQDGSVGHTSAVNAAMEWLDHRRRTIRAASRNKVASWSRERNNQRVTLLAIKHAKRLIDIVAQNEEPAQEVADELDIEIEQAKYLLDNLTLSRMSSKRVESITKKMEELTDKIDAHTSIVEDNAALDAALARQISAVRKKFGYNRVCAIHSHEEDVYKTRPKGPMVKEPPKKGFLAIGENGHIRWAFRDNIARELDGDYFTRLVPATSAESIYAVSNFGFVSKLPMSSAPREATGIQWHMVNNGYELDQGEEILSIFTSSELAKKSLALLTDSGRLKVVSSSLYEDMRNGFKEALTIDLTKENEVIGAVLFEEGDTLGALTSTGKFSMYEMTEDIYKEKGAKARATAFVKIPARNGGELVWFGNVPDSAQNVVYQNGNTFGLFNIIRDEDVCAKVNVVGSSVSNLVDIGWCQPVTPEMDTLCVASSDYDKRVEVPLAEMGEPSRKKKLKDMIKVDGSDEIYATVYLDALGTKNNEETADED